MSYLTGNTFLFKRTIMGDKEIWHCKSDGTTAKKFKEGNRYFLLCEKDRCFQCEQIWKDDTKVIDKEE